MAKIIVEGDYAENTSAGECYEPTTDFIVSKGNTVNIVVGPDSKKLILIGDVTDGVDCNIPDNPPEPVDTHIPEVVEATCIQNIDVGSQGLKIAKDGGPLANPSLGAYTARSTAISTIDA
jgi:hypothetical protein